MAIDPEPIGFIGAGALGRAIVRRLLASGSEVWIWNRTRSKAEILAEDGAAIADNIATLCGRSRLILSCVSDDEALAHICGQIERANTAKGAVHVSMSTVSPAAVISAVDGHARHAIAFLAAPVLGRPKSVCAGQAGVLVAGPVDAARAAIPVLGRIGTVSSVGERPADAALFKLALNYLVASAIASMGEAFAVLERAGLDPEILREILAAGPFSGPIHTEFSRVMLDGAYTVAEFRLALGAKDLSLFCQSAEAVGGRPLLAGALQNLFVDAIKAGAGELDWAGVMTYLRQQTAGSAT